MLAPLAEIAPEKRASRFWEKRLNSFAASCWQGRPRCITGRREAMKKRLVGFGGAGDRRRSVRWPFRCNKPVLGCDYRLTVTWQERKSVTEPIPLTTAKRVRPFREPRRMGGYLIENARAGLPPRWATRRARAATTWWRRRPARPETFSTLRFATTPVMLLVVDTAYPMWATGNANVVAGLANMYVTIKFTPLDWKEGGRMNRWSRRRGNSTATRMSIFLYGRNCG